MRPVSRAESAGGPIMKSAFRNSFVSKIRHSDECAAPFFRILMPSFQTPVESGIAMDFLHFEFVHGRVFLDETHRRRLDEV